MNNVDKLFKGKLADYEMAPRAQAWEKLEGQLSKKNKAIVWIRLAAALALISLLTYFLVSRENTSQPEMAKVETPVATETVEAKPTQKDESKVALVKEKKPTKRPLKVAVETTVPIPVEETEVEASTIEMVASVETETQKAITTESVPGKVVEQPTAQKSIVLVYALPALSKPTTTEPVVVTGDEKQKGFQKILETARDVKNSDNPWGDLREAKNELLALDFKKDKNRNQ